MRRGHCGCASLPIIRVEYRAMGTNEGKPHWLAVCRESAALRGIPVGVSRAPLSPVDAEVREELRAMLDGLGQLERNGPGAVSEPRATGTGAEVQ